MLHDLENGQIVRCQICLSPDLKLVLDLGFHALADATRRAVIARLHEGEAAATELAEPFDMALPTFLKHLKVLEAGGLITTRKEGRKRMCRLEREQLARLSGWIHEYETGWQNRPRDSSRPADRPRVLRPRDAAQYANGRHRAGVRRLHPGKPPGHLRRKTCAPGPGRTPHDARPNPIMSRLDNKSNRLTSTTHHRFSQSPSRPAAP